MTISKLRHTRGNPCGICGGHESAPQGNGQRCWGFTSADGEYIHCTREEFAGDLDPHPGSNAFVHRMIGDCRCGVSHDNRPGTATTRASQQTRQAKRIVKTYDYRDENGNLLFQEVRYEPKGFQQRRPDGNGGWIWSVKGVRLVPYRLAELLAADPNAITYIVEGPKDADRLHALRLTATTNPMGAGSWRPEFAHYLAHRHVAILPDNDRDGLSHAEKVAQSLSSVAATLKVVELPGLGPKGDVSDWLDAGGTIDELQRLVETASCWEPPADSPMTASTLDDEELLQTPSDEVESFPIQVFPKPLQRLIEAVSAALSCPPEFVAVPVLAVLGTAIGASRVLQVKAGWREGAGLYVAIVAMPGSKKSPALTTATQPLMARQALLKQAYDEEKVLYESDMAAYGVEKAQWNEQVKKAAKANEEAPKDPPREPEEPVMRQVVTTDSTIEALAELMHRHPRGLAFVRDELSAWVRSMNQYRGGKGADQQYWLSFWNRAPVVVNRKSRKEPLMLTDPFVSVIGCIPPDILGELRDERGREEGFIHRILFTFPDHIPPRYSEDEILPDVLAEYQAVVDRLWDLQPTIDDRGNIGPVVLTFTPEAKDVFVAWIREHHAEMADDALPLNLLGPWAKLDGYCVRLALIVHLARFAAGETTSEQVDRRSMLAAAALIEYFKSHARRVYTRLHFTEDDKRAALAVRWIRGRGGSVSARQLLQYRVGGVKKAAAAESLLRELQERGYGTLEEGSRRSLVFTLKAAAS